MVFCIKISVEINKTVLKGIKEPNCGYLTLTAQGSVSNINSKLVQILISENQINHETFL